MLRTGFSDEILHIEERKLHYVVGLDNGLPLVLIPGQGLSWESYKRSLPLLSKDFQVYAVDVRGHGKSSWTPGQYNIPHMGKDIASLLEKVIKSPSIISGNSSGGLIALWLAANMPKYVLGIILEDAPVFSSEWPRLRDDCWVYQVFKRNSETIGSPDGRDLAGFFKTIQVPVEGKQKVIQFPNSIGNIMAGMIRLYQWLRPGKPVDIPILPPEVRLIIKCLSEYDPGFTRAFVDGSGCEGFSHGEALKKVKCPMLVLHANSFRDKKYGLVGSMDEIDVCELLTLVPHCEYKRIASGHMIHFEKPKEFVDLVLKLKGQILNETIL